MKSDLTERLPTREEVARDSLDGRYAIQHFHGKTLAEAEQTFADGLRDCIPLTYTEDLMWMEPVGFRFYIRAAIRVALSDQANGESDFINGLAGTLAFWHKEHPSELDSCAVFLADSCRQVFEQFDRYDANPKIYMGLREQYQHLAELFTLIAGETRNA